MHEGEASVYGELRVNVTAQGTVCDSSAAGGGPLGARNTTVEFRGRYGNVFNMTLLNSLRTGDSKTPVNLTLTADKGTNGASAGGTSGGSVEGAVEGGAWSFTS